MRMQILSVLLCALFVTLACGQEKSVKNLDEWFLPGSVSLWEHTHCDLEAGSTGNSAGNMLEGLRSDWL